MCHFSEMAQQFAEVPEHELALRIITTKQYFYNTSSQGYLTLCLGYPLSVLTSNAELPSSSVTSGSNYHSPGFVPKPLMEINHNPKADSQGS